jgi:hypothetical protein
MFADSSRCSLMRIKNPKENSCGDSRRSQTSSRSQRLGAGRITQPNASGQDVEHAIV